MITFEILIFLSVLSALFLFDGVLTVKGLRMGGTEQNPIMQELFKSGTNWLYFVKLIGVVIFIALAITSQSETMSLLVFGLGAVIYGGVVGWNLSELRYQRKLREARP